MTHNGFLIISSLLQEIDTNKAKEVVNVVADKIIDNLEDNPHRHRGIGGWSVIPITKVVKKIINRDETDKSKDIT